MFFWKDVGIQKDIDLSPRGFDVKPLGPRSAGERGTGAKAWWSYSVVYFRASPRRVGGVLHCFGLLDGEKEAGLDVLVMKGIENGSWSFHKE